MLQEAVILIGIHDVHHTVITYIYIQGLSVSYTYLSIFVVSWGSRHQGTTKIETYRPRWRRKGRRQLYKKTAKKINQVHGPLLWVQHYPLTFPKKGGQHFRKKWQFSKLNGTFFSRKSGVTLPDFNNFLSIFTENAQFFAHFW